MWIAVLLVLPCALGGPAEADAADPQWGCGLLGAIPGISREGIATPDTQNFINGIKASSSFGKAHYWNWDYVPRTVDGQRQHLSKDFIFMPENWGVGPATADKLLPGGTANFTDGDGNLCPAEMGTILLGANEPDMVGSCMGTMMGKCTAPCLPNETPCPACHAHGPPEEPLPNGHCDCWSFSHATGVGYWPLTGCKKQQPLPTLWQDNDTACINIVMDNWKQTAALAASKGYKHLSAPLVAKDLDWARQFIERACTGCTEPACGCPDYVSFHFYAYDCQPEQGDYVAFQGKLRDAARIMEDYPFVKGAIVNEVGMLNCARDGKGCVPNSGTHPASQDPHHGCPSTPALPQGLASFLDQVLNISITAKTHDGQGRPVVKAFTWFSENQDGGTYDQRLFNDAGQVTDLGKAYMAACNRWAPARSANRAVAQILV